jgi:hypothetical protein
VLLEIVEGGYCVSDGVMKYKVRQLYTVVCCIVDVKGGLFSRG